MSSFLIDRKLRKAGIPINGVTETGGVDSPDFSIEFAANATEQQIADANAMLAAFDRPLEQHRYEIDGRLSDWWNTKQSLGITPSGQSFRLGMTGTDVALLTGQFVLASTSVSLGLKTQTDTFTIVDQDNAAHDFTLAALTAVLLDYGQQRGVLSGQFVTYETAINQAAAIADLDAISFE